MEQSQEVHDVLVMGGGVAGALAARLLVQSGRDILLCAENEHQSNESPWAWIGPLSIDLLRQVGVQLSDIGARRIDRFRFFTSDLNRQTSAELSSDLYLMEVSRLARALEALLCLDELGHYRKTTVAHLSPKEEHVCCQFQDSTTCRGRLMLVGSSAGRLELEKSGLISRPISRAGLWQVEFWGSIPSNDPVTQMDLIMGLDEGQGYGYRVESNGLLGLGVCARTSRRVHEEIMGLSERLVRQNMVPERWRECIEFLEPVWRPAGLSLDMESHVVKRALLFGEAGGFVTTFSNDWVYPFLKSAQMAAGVADEVMEMSNFQDKIREYDSLWRLALVEYLRAPNTDLQSLTPLVFVNQQVANKMLSAMLLGKNF